MAQIGYFLLALASLLLCAEAAVRVCDLAPEAYDSSARRLASPFEFSENPKLRYRYKRNFVPSEDSDFPRRELAGKEQTNSLGFRDREHPEPTSGKAVRVFLTGSSNLDGNFAPALVDHRLGIFDRDELFATRVGALLSPRGVEVFNFGVDGQCPASNLEILRRYVPVYRPKLVILVIAGFDFPCFQMLEAVPREPSAFFQAIFKYSAAFRLLTLTSGRPDFEKGISYSALLKNGRCERVALCKKLFLDIPLSERHARESKGKTMSPEKIDALMNFTVHADGEREQKQAQLLLGRRDFRSFSGDMRSISELVRAHGGDFAVALWPRFEELGYDSIDPREINPETGESLAQLASRLGFKVVRLSELFGKAYPGLNPLRDLTVGDALHPSENGASKLSPVLARLVLSLLKERPFTATGR